MYHHYILSAPACQHQILPRTYAHILKRVILKLTKRKRGKYVDSRRLACPNSRSQKRSPCKAIPDMVLRFIFIVEKYSAIRCTKKAPLSAPFFDRIPRFADAVYARTSSIAARIAARIAAGSAAPLVAFIACPINAPIAFSAPPR